MAAAKQPPAPTDLVPVTLPSGGNFWVYRLEAKHFEERVQRYQADNAFSNVSDLQTLDMILTMELLTWRWANWISQQTDYHGDPIDEKEINATMKSHSTELRQLKAALGIDKVTRDKVKGEDSISEYLNQLRLRAKAFGVTREKQLDKALELFHELAAKVTLHVNANDEERKEFNARWEDILSWLQEEAIPEFHEIDAHFREKEQKLWIRRQ